MESHNRDLKREMRGERFKNKTEPIVVLRRARGGVAGLPGGNLRDALEAPGAVAGSGPDHSIAGGPGGAGGKMDLRQHIRSGRADRRRKRDLTPSLFDRVSGLVKEFSLGEAFLRRLDEIPDELGETDLKFDGAKPKPPYEPPLFSLCTESEYRVTMTIIGRLGNRYLEFVNSPDEILLCEPLFRQNPSLPPERLARFHFETLLLAEAAQKRLQGLGEQVQRLLDGPGSEQKENPQLPLLRARAQEVQRVLARLEEAGCR